MPTENEPGRVDVTVAICTWNRAALLDQTLARLTALRVPAGLTWELLVVNNNCTDHTDEVIGRLAGALPLRRLAEPTPGLSNARNRAIEAARGDLLVWTDDDVLVEPDWLAEYVAAAGRFPHAGYFGGTVDPWFAAEPPRWVVRNLEHVGGPFALRQLGPDVRPFAGTEAPFGANMAFRTAALREHRFDPKLGRIGAGMLSGEETALIHRLRTTTGPGVWVGPARVRHYIPADRMTTGYVWKFFHGIGRTEQRLRGLEPGTPLVRGVPRWAIRRYAVARAKSLVFAPFESSRWIKNFIAAARAKGEIDECRARWVARQGQLDTAGAAP
jgi:hypothetical protein